jgi:hypothetical protein
MAREVISELTGSQGKIGESTKWETLEFGTGTVKLRNGSTVGFFNSNGELDSAKCKALGKFPYTALRNELEVEAQLRIEIRTLVPDESVCLWGGNASTSSISVKSERYMLYNDGTNTLPYSLMEFWFTKSTNSGEEPSTEFLKNTGHLDAIPFLIPLGFIFIGPARPAEDRYLISRLDKGQCLAIDPRIFIRYQQIVSYDHGDFGHSSLSNLTFMVSKPSA